jgi:hypothetical protein
MPNNDIEVFEYLISDKETALEIDYLTYAMFAFKKKQWVDHFEKIHARKPDQAQIDDWMSQLTEYDFWQMRNEAGDFFDLSAKDYLKDYIENEKQEAIDKSILDRVKSYTSAWKHFGVALLMAILAPIFLGGVIFLISIFDSSFPIHVTFSNPAEQHNAPK